MSILSLFLLGRKQDVIVHCPHCECIIWPTDQAPPRWGSVQAAEEAAAFAEFQVLHGPGEPRSGGWRRPHSGI